MLFSSLFSKHFTLEAVPSLLVLLSTLSLLFAIYVLKSLRHELRQGRPEKKPHISAAAWAYLSDRRQQQRRQNSERRAASSH